MPLVLSMGNRGYLFYRDWLNPAQSNKFLSWLGRPAILPGCVVDQRRVTPLNNRIARDARHDTEAYAGVLHAAYAAGLLPAPCSTEPESIRFDPLGPPIHFLVYPRVVS